VGFLLNLDILFNLFSRERPNRLDLKDYWNFESLEMAEETDAKKGVLCEGKVRGRMKRMEGVRETGSFQILQRKDSEN